MAAAARRFLSRRATSSPLSALLRRGSAADVPEQQLLRPAVVAVDPHLGFARGMARRPRGDGFSPAHASNKLEELPGVLSVLPDPYADRGYKDYGGQYANLFRAQAFTSRSIPVHFHQLIHISGISTTRNLLADDAMVPVSSPLTPPLGDSEETEKKGTVVKRQKVQAIKKDIKQSPKKVNLVAKLVRGMRVEDALLQLQVTVKRAAKTVYQVIHSARANAAHNHGLDPDKLIVEEAFVGKGLYLKRLSYHAKGRCGVMVRPRCRLTVVVREATAEEEAKIAKLRVSNYKKLTRKERQLMPHRLIEVSPRWARKRKEEAAGSRP